ncbi:MAG: hypothetical protein KH208_04855 [Desulfovibrio sp.]|uniref:hypothetical protein n=1 Tax=Desulfovibrio sp. TaxID=885 RepID=UPI0025B9DB17|nr:hypothetical protein [Desulfovibrio sp.]MBS6829192.1 hypothetical protein [Desulfovibrio sp.]
MTVSSILSGVRVSYFKYICAHRKCPKGCGTWAFHMGEGDMFFHTGTFTEAKRAAVKEAKRRGVDSISVGS